VRKSIFILLVVFFLIFNGTYDVFARGIIQKSFDLVLITDSGSVNDKSFNQGAWEGLVQYAKERKISHKYYNLTEQSNEACLAIIDLAVKNGAKIIVTSGVFFEAPVFIAQERYPNVRFILVDGVPRNPENSTYRTGNNTVGILYAEDQAGFLAGYAAVKDGNRRLGFIGGEAIPPVVRYGYGFIQGVEYAAEELGLAAGSITMNYHYTGNFNATPEAQMLAASWYNSGIEVIFACGGAVGNSVMAAAEQTGKKMIGVDIDQSSFSSTVITSAMKGLRVSVYNCIADHYAGRFPGGKNLVFSAYNNGISLPMATSRFQVFNQSDYDAIFQKLVNGTIRRVENLDITNRKGNPSVIPVTRVRIAYSN